MFILSILIELFVPTGYSRPAFVDRVKGSVEPKGSASGIQGFRGPAGAQYKNNDICGQ